MKQCSKCNQTKQLNKFGKNKSNKDGLTYFCKICTSVVGKRYYVNNKASTLGETKVQKKANSKRTKTWKLNNPEKTKEHQATYRKTNKKLIAARSKAERSKIDKHIDTAVKAYKEPWGANRIEINNNTMKIYLSQDTYTTIDTELYHAVRPFNWQLFEINGSKYASASFKGTRILLHRVITKANSEIIIDHANRNGLDNCINNLRECTKADALRNSGIRKTNTSGYKGVSYHSGSKKWQASIRYNGIQHYLGVFDNIEDAAQAYDLACEKYHKKFAVTNSDLKLI